MCGLIGAISKNTYGFSTLDKDIIEQMLYADAVRGWDSTGVFGINKHGNALVVKQAVPAAGFLMHPETKTFLNKIVSEFKIVIGHNRKATHGEKVSENAHPFWSDDENIILVHNGMISNHRELDKDKTVDSHALCNAISKTDDVLKLLGKVTGAYALIWYNVKEKKLYFCHNDQRPLYLIETKETLLMASEHEMAEWIAGRNKREVTQVVEVQTNFLLSINLNTVKINREGEVPKVASFFPTVVSQKITSNGAAESTQVMKVGDGGIIRTAAELDAQLKEESYVFLNDDDVYDAMLLSKEYAIDKLILFMAQDYQEWVHKDTGECFVTVFSKPVNMNNDLIKIKTVLTQAQFNKANLTKVLKARITAIRVSTQGICIISTMPFVETDKTTTINDKIISKDMYHNLWFPGSCEHCKSPVLYEDLKDCVVTSDSGIVNVYCPQCTKDVYGKDYFDPV